MYRKRPGFTAAAKVERDHEKAMTPTNYDPNQCDLCGETDADTLIELASNRSLLSDRRIVPITLRKKRCNRCGLVRDGNSHDGLEHYYSDDYSVAPGDYVFFSPDGPVKRSALFCNWITTAFGHHRWKGVRRCLEVGAGSGAVLAEFKARFPDMGLEGLELCASAVREAILAGRSVRQGTVHDAAQGAYDAAYAIAVIEHVPSPTAFLRDLRSTLRPGGLLFLCQPTQEVPSYDVFFVDHLHHFGTAHMRSYSAKCGFHELGHVVGHEWMPNFSLHLWEAAEAGQAASWRGPPAQTACEEVARRTLGDMRRLNAILAASAQASRRVAVFGLNEVYALARAYSDLDSHPLVCGLEDRPDNLAYSALPFPVVKPEAARRYAIDDMLLTVNKVYYPQLARRLADCGADLHPVLS
jgi:SAM-dependent methyltransferase